MPKTEYWRRRVTEGKRAQCAAKYGERNEKIREMYRSGMSTREISRKIGLDAARVYKICRDIARPHLKPESKHWRTNRSRARKIMEKHLGRKLDRSQYVHHINGDYTDNRLENLVVMPASDHVKHHVRKADQPHSRTSEYHRWWRDTHKERIYAREMAWRKANPEKMAAARSRQDYNRRQFPHVCEQCGKSFQGLKKSRLCSRVCVTAYVADLRRK